MESKGSAHLFLCYPHELGMIRFFVLHHPEVVGVKWC